MKRICCLLMICLLCLPLCAQGQAQWEITELRDEKGQLTQGDDACAIRVRFLAEAEDGDLSFLLNYPRLQRVCIENGFVVDDLSVFASLPQLEYLDIPGGIFTDVTPLAALTRLQVLDLSYTLIRDARALGGLTQLRTLDLTGCDRITDFSFLNDLTNMEDLYLSFTQITNLSFARHMKNLSDVCFAFTAVSDLSPLLECPELTAVVARWCRITDISNFCQVDFPHLYIASFVGNPIGDISPLLNLSFGAEVDVSLPTGGYAYYWEQVEQYVKASPQEQAALVFHDAYGQDYR